MALLQAGQSFSPSDSSKVEITGPEEPNQSDGDQINGDDVVQQAGHDQNQNPGYQRYQGCKSQVDVHELASFFR
jgi:hypothetical protein